jgi:hypothetical protein
MGLFPPEQIKVKVTSAVWREIRHQWREVQLQWREVHHWVVQV